ncbi:hypothetical protein [Psychrobacter sp. MES7-P7E]|uniref:hypothetical protein n=1 Tax=Psychrobacter sp. MES7-P7E TaxID=2058322 RepID=UPI000C7BE909|nr:hypothetical protein [Psychrobacter sp. MES7-P7E]PLT23755.1 hypothetical protein CXF62_00290 [Psychrobacter sp. MES7-P7E]
MADLPKLRLKPLREGYSFNLGRQTVTTQTESGQPRQRKASVGTVHTLSPTYKCTRVQMQYLHAFLRAYEAQPFLAYLLIDDIDHKWYECRIVSDDIPVSALGDQIFTVQLSITATPISPSLQADLVNISAYDVSDGNPKLFFYLLEQLVNVDLPNAP